MKKELKIGRNDPLVYLKKNEVVFAENTEGVKKIINIKILSITHNFFISH
jgi:hypothetical protein